MTDQAISTDVLSLQADVLDHSSEFVELVFREAPTEYQRLMVAERFRRELEQDNAFNHGKLFAYAEFVVFRREFRERFPGSSPAACTKAWSNIPGVSPLKPERSEKTSNRGTKIIQRFVSNRPGFG